MSRYDYIKISDSLLPVNGFQRHDLSGLEFQTKDLDREFLDYVIDEDGNLSYTDYEYELVEAPDNFFRFSMRRINKGVINSNHSGYVKFYGKPYEIFYIFKAKFTNGKLDTIERVL
jgi:chromosome condensin MukBEF MukE localization factor